MSTETCLSGHHNMISTFMRAHLVRLQPKKISYRSFKRFNKSSFLSDLQYIKFNCDSDDPNKNYTSHVDYFRNIVDKHGHLKQKIVRGNQVHFMNRNIKKAIYIRSRLKNKYNKNQTNENNIKYKN